MFGSGGGWGEGRRDRDGASASVWDLVPLCVLNRCGCPIVDVVVEESGYLSVWIERDRYGSDAGRGGGPNDGARRTGWKLSVEAYRSLREMSPMTPQ